MALELLDGGGDKKLRISRNAVPSVGIVIVKSHLDGARAVVETIFEDVGLRLKPITGAGALLNRSSFERRFRRFDFVGIIACYAVDPTAISALFVNSLSFAVMAVGGTTTST